MDIDLSVVEVMHPARHEFEIFKSVVVTIAIDMVHNLIESKLASKSLTHHHSVHLDLLTVPPDIFVSRYAVWIATTLLGSLPAAFTRTELAGITGVIPSSPSTILAGEVDHKGIIPRS